MRAVGSGQWAVNGGLLSVSGCRCIWIGLFTAPCSLPLFTAPCSLSSGADGGEEEAAELVGFGEE